MVLGAWARISRLQSIMVLNGVYTILRLTTLRDTHLKGLIDRASVEGRVLNRTIPCRVGILLLRKVVSWYTHTRVGTRRHTTAKAIWFVAKSSAQLLHKTISLVPASLLSS